MKFSEQEYSLLQDVMNTEYHDSFTEKTCGKVVRIDYWRDFDKRREMPFETTYGVIVNWCPSYTYIINKNGCFEVFQTKDIKQMVEVKLEMRR